MNEMINPIILEILKDSGGTFALEITKWTTIGVTCGVILMPLVFFLLKALNAYRLNWIHSKMCKILVFILTLILSAVLSGFIGFNQGFYVAVERSLGNEKFKQIVLPSIGSTGADLLAHIYIIVPLYEKPSNQSKNDVSSVNPEKKTSARLEEFREGKWELDLNVLSERIISAKKAFIHDVITQMNSELSRNHPNLSEEVGDKLFDWISEHFVEWIIQDDLESSGLMYWIRAGAARFEQISQNDPQLTYSELSAVIGDILIKKGIITPVRTAVRINQIGLIMALFALFAAPPLIFRTVNFVRSHKIVEQALKSS